MRVILVLSIIVAISFSFHSCSKSNNNNGTTDSAYMKAIVNGSAFSTVKPGSTSAQLSQAGGINYVYVNGLDSNGTAIQLTLTNISATGSFAFGNGNASTGSVTAYYFSSGGFNGPSTYANAGSVVITSLSPNIMGTFNFTTTPPNSITVASGTFSVQAPQ
jgi:hypothetical protein